MKSYGEKWAKSRATATIERRQILQPDQWVLAHDAPHIMTGTHGKETSETYRETVQLHRSSQTTGPLRVPLSLTGGTTVKLMGIAVCQ